VTAIDVKQLAAEKLIPRQGIEFSYGDVTFKCPPRQAWPLEYVEWMAEGSPEKALDAMTEPGTYARLRDAGMTAGEMGLVLEALGFAVPS
jgi:hypothetical protein